MGLLFVYIIKSSICLAIFYLFYRLLMTRETFHRFNRFALLGILLLSCLLPLIEVSVKQQTEVAQTMLTLEQLLMMADAMGSADAGAQVQGATVNWIQVALLVYLAGILFFAFRNVYSLARLMLLVKSGRREKIDDYLPGKDEYVTLIVHDRDIAPFSWMKYIVISRKDLEEDGREILIHELAHIHNRHSWDLLVADLCIFLQWFNPASWLLKQELQNIHEFEADETVIKEGVDAKQYQLLLIKKAVGTRLYSMANSFNHSKLKKRITMMLKEKSSPWARLKYLYVLPVAAIAVTAFARPEISEKVEEISVVKVNDLAAIVETKAAESMEKTVEMPVVKALPAAKALPADTVKPKYVPVPVVGEVDDIIVLGVEGQMPEFPGGMSACLDYLQKNMRYPESAKQAGTQGRVTVQFVVDKDGGIKNPKVVRPVDKELDAEAIRLIQSMPKWKPGMEKGQAVAVKYTLPVAFKLEGSEPDKPSHALSDVTIYIDNVEIDSEGKGLNEVISADEIDNIRVEKDASGKGAIYITSKKATKAEKAGYMKVEGQVQDKEGNPVIGASVLLEGTNMGTVTNVDGKFVLSVPEKNSVLSISYIDMETAKVKAEPKLVVTLKDE